MLEALAAIVKVLLYAGVLSCAGAVFATMTMRQNSKPGIAPLSAELARFSAQIVRRGALVTIAAAVGNALLLFIRLGGQWDEATLSAVFISGAGAATCLQLAGAALLIASADDPTALGTQLSTALLMTLSFAFSGHAAAMDLRDGLIAFVHVSAAAWWVGSLWLLRHACTHLDRSAVTALVRQFSTIATTFIGALVMAGLVLIAVLVDFNQLPRFSPYEQIFALKLGGVACVLGIATYNRFRLTPRLATEDLTAVSVLRRMIAAELVLIAVILAITAILTTYTSPHDYIT